MRSFRAITSIALGSILGTTTVLTAQPPARIDFSTYGQYTFFDSELPFDDAFGGGARIGFLLLPWLGVEGEAAYAATQDRAGLDIGYIPLRGRVLLRLPLGERLELLTGPGLAQNFYVQDADGAEIGATGLFGVRAVLGRTVTLRVDGVADLIPNPAAEGPTDVWNIGVQAGIGIRVGPRFARRGAPSDLDRDGIADYLDACPDTRPDLTVDARGCPLPADSDGDGVVDERDSCAGTRAGVAVDSRGCPLPADADGDGVPDADDACSGTPAGVAVDSRGCPLPADADGDGVPDADDACSNTPAGIRVDSRGCPMTGDRDGDGVPDEDDACPSTPARQPVDPRGCALPVDSDGDGVRDLDDACPRTPSGTLVDARGCPRGVDSDGDGVLDRDDACAQTPIGTRVDERGCPLGVDSDGDGVPDRDDACADTPSGVRVDARGCPAAGGDSDDDGVPDDVDRCPGTPAGERVDGSGCQLLFEGGSTEILEGVTFTRDDTYELTAGARAILEGVARWLVAHPEIPVEVAAHTDNTVRYAQIRSLGRASAVRRYLMAQGVSGTRILARGYGSDQPIASNATAAGRERNNRIELRRLD